MKNYKDFLNAKLVKTQKSGFSVGEADIHPKLFDWQNAVVRWALDHGKAALFEECGLGKTLQQVEWARHVHAHTGGNVLIVSPLAVAHQTVREAEKIGVTVKYIRSQEEADSGIYITNYDILKSFDGAEWAGVVLDESSILKSYTGSIKRMILEMFETVPYKLACTATPAPNDYLELGNHAEFLNVMRSNEMIQRWFINDTMQAGGYRLKKHAEGDYWKWVTSWAVCISRPSDLGFQDECKAYSFDMPKLVIHEERVSVDHSRAFEKGQLFVDSTLSATDLWREKKMTYRERCERAAAIIGKSRDFWIVWCDTNEEADYLMELLPKAVEVRGSDSIKEKERKLSEFSDGKAKVIITKSDIAGFGLNWQHCHKMVFVGVTYSFEKTYQALRRSWRFGQTKDVQAYMISAESEGEVVKVLKEKEILHKEMQQSMNTAMKANGLGKTDHRAAVEYIGIVDMTTPEWLTSIEE